MAKPEKHLLIIGGNAAGLSAARRARRNDPRLKITVLEKSGIVSYGACGLPYYISDVIKDEKALLVLPVDALVKDGIDVLLNHEVVEMNVRERSVYVRTAEQFQKIHYDWLIIASGARPIEPDIPGRDLDGVYTVRSLEKAAQLKNELISGKHRSAVVIGGGYIGLEMAEALTRQGLKVTVIEQKSQVLPYIDSDMAALVESEMTGRGVALKTSTVAVRIIGEQAVRGVETDGGEILSCSLVILAVGVRPNADFAGLAGIELGPSGAIRTDDYLRTNVLNVYAAGDCAQVKNTVTNKFEYFPLGTTANKQGRVAGDNATGRRQKFSGVVGAAVVEAFGLEIARTGITEAHALKLRMPVKSVTIKGTSRAGYFPGKKEIYVKLIFDFLSGRLLGAQMVGQEGVAKRLDVLSTALQQKLTVQELSELDLSYAPPFAPVWDPLLIAANQAQKLVWARRY